jgi:hypothetical protein
LVGVALMVVPILRVCGSYFLGGSGLRGGAWGATGSAGYFVEAAVAAAA